jgi:hypothetical protein
MGKSKTSTIRLGLLNCRGKFAQEVGPALRGVGRLVMRLTPNQCPPRLGGFESRTLHQRKDSKKPQRKLRHFVVLQDIEAYAPLATLVSSHRETL